MDEAKIISIREELEAELTWRENELKLLKNQLVKIQSKKEQNIYRKSLVVMLYAHYEGFCNFAFQTYVIAINEERLLRKQVNNYLAAASMHQEFTLFENEEFKERQFKKIFGQKPPEDRKLFKLSKRKYLLDALEDFLEQIMIIPDKVVNTESNLRPLVLKKLLYSLGLPENSFSRYEANITELVNTRNAISHGQQKDGIDGSTFERLEKTTRDINNAIIILIYDALRKKLYLKDHFVVF